MYRQLLIYVYVQQANVNDQFDTHSITDGDVTQVLPPEKNDSIV